MLCAKDGYAPCHNECTSVIVAIHGRESHNTRPWDTIGRRGFFGDLHETARGTMLVVLSSFIVISMDGFEQAR